MKDNFDVSNICLFCKGQLNEINYFDSKKQPIYTPRHMDKECLKCQIFFAIGDHIVFVFGCEGAETFDMYRITCFKEKYEKKFVKVIQHGTHCLGSDYRINENIVPYNGNLDDAVQIIKDHKALSIFK
jgi:hypothetical protein